MPFGNHTLLLDLEGELWAFGANSFGQLGVGSKDKVCVPTKVSWNGPKPVQVDGGLVHSLVLDEEGGVWEAGRSRAAPYPTTFQLVTDLPPVSRVAAGYCHSAAVDINGALWVWTNAQTDLQWASCTLTRVEGLPPVQKVVCGRNFLLAEAQEGGFWVLGDNPDGQLGLGHIIRVQQPTQVDMEELFIGPARCLAAFLDGIVIIDSQGTVFTAGSNTSGQIGRGGSNATFQHVQGIPPMIAASCGSLHGLCLDENGGAWAWGRGKYGQLGTRTNAMSHTLVLHGVAALVAGASHSLAFLNEGGLLVFGDNSSGQLGLGHFNNQYGPTPAPISPALPLPPTLKRLKSARSQDSTNYLGSSPPDIGRLRN